jgi:lipopolysaccharide export LptBFGC system permease protein LptF
MEGIMKKLIFIICLAMFMVTGCTSGNDNKPAGNNSQNESQMQSRTDNDNVPSKSESKYIWEEEPLYDSNIDMSGAVDETLSKVISIYNGNSDAKELITDDVKADMTSIIEKWYNNKFYNVKNIKKSEMLKLDIESCDKELVMCDGRPYIKVTFRVSAMNGGLRGEDKLNALLDCSNDRYSVYKMWYYGKYRNTSGSF